MIAERNNNYCRDFWILRGKKTPLNCCHPVNITSIVAEKSSCDYALYEVSVYNTSNLLHKPNLCSSNLFYLTCYLEIPLNFTDLQSWAHKEICPILILRQI